MIVEGIKEKKGQDIIVIDLLNISNAPCSFFVICSATSRIQVNAIINNIIKLLYERLGLRVLRDEGRHSDWCVLDYFDIVIHVFTEETREHYKLEKLWADGIIKNII